jgi:predicted secreted acid phosphatase
MIVRKRPHRCGNEVRHQIGLRRCVGALAAMLGAALVPVVVSAAECPARLEPSIPPPESVATPDKPMAKGFNIDTYKRQLTKYHDGKYNEDIAAVMAEATRHVLRRAGEVTNPAVVLDIDETSLSNWDNLKADDFGFIEGGTCPVPLQDKMPCGFNAWIDQAKAPEIKSTLEFFNAIRSKKDDSGKVVVPNIAVFFITGRRDKQRGATLWNLDRAGFKGWAGVATRPDDQHGSIVPFKSGERIKIKKDYTILANIGDQDSDLEDPNGITAECSFKLPNPYYFIP